MIIAYHAIFTTYGTWLPNDPRGSYSKQIYQEELRALGDIQYGRQAPQPSREHLSRFRIAAQPLLNRTPVYFDENCRNAVAHGFNDVVQRLQLTVNACAIMSNHVHLLILRAEHRIEYLVNQLKGAATRALGHAGTPWTRGLWKIFIDNEDALIAAARYIERNPIVAGLPGQDWGFVKRLSDP